MMKQTPPEHFSQRLTSLFTRRQRGEILNRNDVIQFGICLVIIILFVGLLWTGWLQRLENLVLDTFFRNRPSLQKHAAVTLLDIDQESLQAIGEWPWPWRYHAEMVRILSAWGARAIVFDMPFRESDRPYADHSLEEAVAASGRVYLPVRLEKKTEKKIWVHALPIVVEKGGEKKEWVHSVAELEAHARGIGHVEYHADPDGVLRRIAPFLTFQKESYPHLALRVAYDLMKQPLPPDPEALRLPYDGQGHFLINWAGTGEVFPRYSYAAIVRSAQAWERGLKPAISPEAIKGKVCWIGVTVPAIADLRVSPIHSAIATSLISLHLLNSFLTEQYVVPVSFAGNAVVLFLIGLVASLFFVFFRNVQSFIAGLGLGFLWAAVVFVVFWYQGLWFYVLHPLILILVLFIFSAIYDHVMARREQRRLFDLATRDGLTGLYVIRHFREILNRAVEEAHEKQAPLSLILLDIDNFKPINDTYGHPAGDMVLKKAAAIIHRCFRTRRPIHEMDFVARYGGEEFIVMLRRAKLPVAAQVAERIRKAVAEGTFEWAAKKIPVTVSVGVATLHKDEKVPDLMVQRADQALYQAKRTGKNKVCTESEITHPT